MGSEKNREYSMQPLPTQQQSTNSQPRHPQLLISTSSLNQLAAAEIQK
jgi:hypothetical protein